MSTTIESLELEILSSSQSAESGLDKLTASLERLRTATKGGLGLTAVAKQLRSVKDAANGINANSINNVTGLANAIKILGGVKISSTIGKQITAVSTALNGADFTGGKDKVESLVKALSPLSSLPKSNLSSYVNSLKKLPDILKSLDDSTISVLTDKMKKLATAMKPLGDEMQKVANGFSAFPAKIQRLIGNTNSLAASNKNAADSYINLWAQLRMAATAVKNIAKKVASCISEMNSYIENVNLFTASMGQYASSAKEYAESVGEIMGIDPGEWMRNQGVFMTLATGFGVAGDRAYTMSQQLTQLGYDLSSFFNIGYEDAMQRLQSGISGELEPLRRLGYDLSQAKLQAVALSLGIDQSISSMTQAEKAQLRYYAIMTQVTTAQGDMARTLNAPANQMRIFKAQVTQAARAIGSIFIPALNAILPYAIAVAKVIRTLASTIASFFGFEMPEVDYSGINAVSTGAEDTSDALDKATKSAKKLKSYMLGFDELNVLSPDDSDSGSGKDALGAGGFDFELPTYDFISEATNNRVAEIVKKMKEWLGITDDIDTWSELLGTRLGSILSTVGLIGGGFLAWKVTKTFMDAISAIKTLLATPSYAIAIGAILTFTGLTLEASGIKDAIVNGLDGFNFAEIVMGALAGTGGMALLGKGIGKLLGSTIGTALGAGIGAIITGIPAYITGIYDAIKNELNVKNASLITFGSTLTGAGIGAIIGSLGGPIGTGVGALIGLAVGLVTDGIILIVENWDTIVEWFKGVGDKIGGFFSSLWDGIKAIWGTVSTWFNTYVITPVGDFFSGLWGGIKSVAKSCWDGIVSFFSPAITWFSTLFNSVKQTISDIFYNIGVIVKGCWDIIKAAWKVAKTWFNDTVVTPIKNIFSPMWTAIKDKASAAWSGIKTTFSKVKGWFNDNLITPVGNFFKNLWSGFKDKAKAAWDGVKSVFGKVGTFFKDTFKKAWEGVVKVFSVAGDIFTNIKDGIVSAFKTVVNALIKGINKVVAVPFNGINTALTKLKNIKILDLKPFEGLKTINVPQIPLLAEGGFPDVGQMFIAREAGPELVGSIGGKTAVVNNDQIVESVSTGVYQAVVAALGSNNTDDGNTQIVINLDGEKIYENQQKIARNRGYNLGMGAFSFG